MDEKTEAPRRKPGKFWAYVAVVVGVLLSLSGFAALIVYLGLPLTFHFGEYVLAGELGCLGGMFLGLVCGPLAVYHGARSILNCRSRPLVLPPFYVFGMVFAVVLGLGNVLFAFNFGSSSVPELLFPPLFMLGAALPTVGVFAWAARRLGWPVTWRQASLALVAGSTLSILVAVVLETLLPYAVFLLVPPLGGLFREVRIASDSREMFEAILFSPVIIVFLVFVALQAPIPEELAKALGVVCFGRGRIDGERGAFATGLAFGAGFAILENMVYEGVYAYYGGWSWGGITLLRAFGSVLHPLCTGMVVLGWYRMREKGGGALLKAYIAAVGLHTLWNGGFMPFIYFTGIERHAGASISLYGEAVEVLLVAFLVVLSAGLWWLLWRITAGLAEGTAPEIAPTFISRRRLAVWAFACALVVIPIGAVLGPAWSEIRAFFLP